MTKRNIKRPSTHFEQRGEKLVSSWVFAKRVLFAVVVSQALVGVALGVGIAGYHWLGGLAWIDALLNASMILGGMGPVDALTGAPAKVFASLYALFSGLIVVAVMGIVLAPVMHRIMHHFHVPDEEAE